MQLPSLLLGVVFHVVNGFLPLTSPTHLSSIPNQSFHPLYHFSDQASTGNGYVPAQIRQAYGLDKIQSQGAGKSIAIVDAYHDANLPIDLQRFSATFSLPELNGLPGKPSCTISAGPHPCVEIIKQGTKSDAGWATEAALDTEWAHAIAGQADLLVVEAKDATAKSMAAALTTAVSKHPTVMSLSWGGNEFSKEADWDPTFSQSMTVAASGDQGTGASFPSVSPNVLSVGGTSLHLSSTGTKIGTETAWSGSGGGASTYENRPIWQAKNLLGVPFTLRLTPDVSYNADPRTGYAVMSANRWQTVGGTSAGAPQWAAMLTLASRAPTNASIYKAGTGASRKSLFTDIVHGNNGTCKTFCQTRPGYDAVTGLGSPIANKLIPAI